MTSSTYRQSSRVTPDVEKLDPGNVLLSRMPLARVDAEALRDAMLFIAGRLDETPFGPPELLFVRHDGMVMTPDFSATERRSIYLQQRRATVHTMLDLFDYPQMGPNCSQRAEHGRCDAGAFPSERYADPQVGRRPCQSECAMKRATDSRTRLKGFTGWP